MIPFRNLAQLGACIAIICAVLAGGCITMAKTMVINATTEPLPVPTPTPEPTPTIEPTISQPEVHVETEPPEKWIARTGGRYLGEPFVWQRENVSMGKDLKFEFKVYDLEFLDSYQWNSRSWGQTIWFTQFPSDGYKYAFVFARMEVVMETPEDDPGTWGPVQPENVYLQYNDTMKIERDTAHRECIVIKEMMYRYTLNDDARVSDYGRLFVPTTTIYDWDEECQQVGYIRGGASNAWDGYLIYQVPENATGADLRVLVGMGSFGTPYWILTDNPKIG